MTEGYKIDADYCTHCEKDTFAIDGVCGWCERSIATGELVAELVEQARLERQRSRWREAAKRQRDRKRPASHQVAE